MNRTCRGKRPFRGKSARANGYLDRTQQQLLLAGVESVVFDKVESNPTKSTVMEGGRAAREHACDFIVALGGGSCIDAAKAIAVMATNDGDFWDYVATGTGKGKKVNSDPSPSLPSRPPQAPVPKRTPEPSSAMRKHRRKPASVTRFSSPDWPSSIPSSCARFPRS